MKNTKINTKEVADLARLSFSEDELVSFQKDMENIIEFANKISDAHIPATPVSKKGNVPLREDTPVCVFRRDDLLSTAPESSTQDGFFTVPRVVE